MHTPTVPRTDVPTLNLRLELQLRRQSMASPWMVEVNVPGTSGRLTFPTLNDLFSYLARLDRPPTGLR